MKLLPNGNIELTVQLMPEAYAALCQTTERDNCARVDVINVAVMMYDAISAAATASGKPLSGEQGVEPKPDVASPVDTEKQPSGGADG